MTRFDLCRRDCIKGMSRLADESVDLVVTSPPYNLGIRYGKFSDTQDRQSYLNWCGEWAEQVRRALKSNGSFFLNIGSAPSNPMLPYEIVMALRGSFVLQNTIHWIKSISIEDREGEVRSYGHFKTIPERLSRIHFSFHEDRSRRTGSARSGRAVSGQEQHCPLASYSRKRSAVSRQYVVHSIRNDSEPREGTTAPGDVSGPISRMVHQAAWRFSRSNNARSVPRHRQFRRRGA